MRLADLVWMGTTAIAFTTAFVLDSPHDWLALGIYAVFGLAYLSGEH